MSPLCSIGERTAGPVRWAEDVQGLYENIPGYVKDLGSPMRDLYKTQQMRDQDILKAEVLHKNKMFYNHVLFEFRADQNTMPLKETLQLSIYSSGNLLLSVNYWEKISKLILISNLSFAVYEKTRKMTETDFLSNIGGLFGLCLGFSIISLAEVFYWFIIRMAKNIGQWI